MTTHSGTYLAEGESGVGIQVLPEAPADSVESLLHDFGLPILAVDLRHVVKGSSLYESLATPIKLRGAGLTHRQNQFATLELARFFDALLFIDTTSHTSLLVSPTP